MAYHLRLLAMGLAVTASPFLSAQNTVLGNIVASAQNATSLQISTGDAVMSTCLGLAARASGTGAPLSAEEQALSVNCTDMVLTAFALDPGLSSDISLGWTSGELAEGMQQLAGEEQASAGRLATETSNNQYANLGMRLDAIRAGSRAMAGGLNVAVDGQPMIGGNAGEDGTGWAWFANGAVGSGNRDASTNEDAYDYDSLGGTIGADYQFASGIVAGLAFGYYDYQIDFDNAPSAVGSQLVNTQAGGGFDTTGYAFSGYAVGNVGRFYIDGLFSYGLSEIESTRVVRYQGGEGGKGGAETRVVNRAMLGETDSQSLSVGVSTGTVFQFESFDLSVDLGLSYLDVSIDGYAEQDTAQGMDTAQFSGLNLVYDGQDFDSLQSRIGFQISRTISFSSGVISPYFSTAWRYEFENDPAVISARLAVQQEGDVFRINAQSDAPDDSFFEIGLGVSAVFANNLQGFLEYRTVADLDNVSADLITIGIRGVF